MFLIVEWYLVLAQLHVVYVHACAQVMLHSKMSMMTTLPDGLQQPHLQQTAAC